MAETKKTSVSEHIQDLDEQLDRLMSDFEPDEKEKKSVDYADHDFSAVVDDEDFETRLSEIEQFEVIAAELDSGSSALHLGAWFLATLEVQDDGDAATKRYVQIRMQSLSDPARAQLVDDLSSIAEEWDHQDFHKGIWLKVSMESDQDEVRKILYTKHRLQLISDERKKSLFDKDQEEKLAEEKSRLEREKKETAKKAVAANEEKEKRRRRINYVTVRLQNSGFTIQELEWGWSLTKAPDYENKKINSYDELIEFCRGRGIDARDDIDPEQIRIPTKKENNGCRFVAAVSFVLVILWLIVE